MDSWAELAAENKAVKLAVGLAPYKLGTDSEPDSAEWKNGTDIVARQIKACLDSEAVTGYVLFSYTSVFSDSKQAHEQLAVKLRKQQRQQIHSSSNPCNKLRVPVSKNNSVGISIRIFIFSLFYFIVRFRWETEVLMKKIPL